MTTHQHPLTTAVLPDNQEEATQQVRQLEYLHNCVLNRTKFKYLAHPNYTWVFKRTNTKYKSLHELVASHAYEVIRYIYPRQGLKLHNPELIKHIHNPGT